VHRLKKTKEGLGVKSLRLFEELRALTDTNHNFKTLRAKVNSVDPPLIPFPGVYQGDLVFLESYGKDMLEGGMVNISKFQKINHSLTEWQVTFIFHLIENRNFKRHAIRFTKYKKFKT
jgi:RasGEF domain